MYKYTIALLLSFNFINSYSMFDQQALNCLLLAAAEKNDTAAAQSLIELGANINAKASNSTSNQNLTALYFALIHENIDLIKLLISEGANLNAKDADGWAPIHQVVHNNKLEIVKLLSENGANLELETEEDLTPLAIAIQRGAKDIVEYLVCKGATK